MMNKKTIIYFLGLWIFASQLTAQNAYDTFNKKCINAAGKVQSSVVTIIVYQKKHRGRRSNLIKTAYASGTVITSDGIIITNHHVMVKGNFYQVFYKGREFALEKFRNKKYYISDPKTDLAILKVTNVSNLTPVTFADSNKISPGEWVLAIGNPYGLSHSISAGIVSSKGRNNIGFADIEDFIQTDVAINPGNSGGPLVDLDGRLVGINTAISTNSGGFQGISFAIPSNIVIRVSRDLVHFGKVRRGWLGFLATETGHNGHTRVQIKSVILGSPAEKAGLKKNDFVIQIDRQKIYQLNDIATIVSRKAIGSRVAITVIREGKTKRFAALILEKTAYKKTQKLLRYLFLRYGFEIENTTASNHVVVSAISPAAWQYGLIRGDTIVSLNGEPVPSLQDFIYIFQQSGKNISYIEINRNSRYYIIDFIKDNFKKQ